METITSEFEFKQCISILKSTGKKARSLRELRSLIAQASNESIFHHTCQYFLKEHIFEYTNDFAQWAGESLEERSLAEHLSNIDPYEFESFDHLRAELLHVIDLYLEEFPEPRDAMAGEEFFFNETVTLIFPAGIRAKNLAEFLMAVKFIDAGSIYYHFYEARMRVAGGTDDFSRWMEESLGKTDLAKRIGAIDPFMHDIEGIRAHVYEEIEEELRKDMEARGVGE